MSLFEIIERVSRLHCFIKEENTGKPEVLSKRLGVSRASLYNIIGPFDCLGVNELK